MQHLNALFLVTLSLITLGLVAETHAQDGQPIHFVSIVINVDITSPRLAHVSRDAVLAVDSGSWPSFDWGLWYEGKTVAITRVFDEQGEIGYIYPTAGSEPDQPFLRILFREPIGTGQTYRFTFEYDVTSQQDSFAWSETLDASQVMIESLSVAIRLPSGYRPTGIEPTSAITQEEGGRKQVTWTGTNLVGTPSVGLTLGYSQDSGTPVSIPELLPYAGGAAALISLGLYGFTRIQASRRPRVKPEVVLEAKAKEAAAQAPRNAFSTGLAVLDYLLKGGLPAGSTTLLTSQVCDERDTVVRRFLERGAKMGGLNVYLAKDTVKIADLLPTNTTSLRALVTRVEAKESSAVNVQFTSNIDNLTGINIDLASVLRSSEPALSKRLCIDLLDEILLVHKSITTRKWVSQLLLKVKSLGFTVLATLNPQMHTTAEVQAIVDLFDGQVELTEKEIEGRERRVIRVKKMFQWDFLDTEAIFDKT